MHQAGRLALASVLAAGAVVTGCDSDSRLGQDPQAPIEQPFTARLAITNDVGTLATIAADITIESGAGVFAGDPDPPCEILAPGGFGVVTLTGEKRVRVAIGSFVGFDTPVELTRCRGTSRIGDLEPSDFTIVVVEALAPDGEPADPSPTVEVIGLETDVVTTTTASDATTTTLEP
jgi:hypothetical protein